VVETSFLGSANAEDVLRRRTKVETSLEEDIRISGLESLIHHHHGFTM
jgi:hypothetical protein